VFGDVDPEDAWDAGDRVAVKLVLLAAIVASILDELAAHGDTVRHRARISDLERLIGEI
jgi:hypothetical protein